MIQNELLMFKIREVIEYLCVSDNALMIMNGYSLVTVEIFMLPFRNTILVP